jgi:hypothetical protein
MGSIALTRRPCHPLLYFSMLCHAVPFLQLHFAQDIGEKPVELFHRLKLYSDDDPTGQTRKPVTSVGTFAAAWRL